MHYVNMLSTLVVLTAYVLVVPAAADTRYVDDELIITLRQGKSTEHKIIKSLKTGTPMEVLEEDKTYLKVRTADGVEGYVLRQYVSSAPPKAQRIAELERLNSSLQEKIGSLEEARSNLAQQLNGLQASYEEALSTKNAKSAEQEQKLDRALNNERIATEKYDTLLSQAENVVEITAERDRLARQNKKIAAEIAALTQENEKLSDARMIKWFLAGGGVFFFGWMVGKISRKKRSRF